MGQLEITDINETQRLILIMRIKLRKAQVCTSKVTLNPRVGKYSSGVATNLIFLQLFRTRVSWFASIRGRSEIQFLCFIQLLQTFQNLTEKCKYQGSVQQNPVLPVLHLRFDSQDQIYRRNKQLVIQFRKPLQQCLYNSSNPNIIVYLDYNPMSGRKKTVLINLTNLFVSTFPTSSLSNVSVKHYFSPHMIVMLQNMLQLVLIDTINYYHTLNSDKQYQQNPFFTSMRLRIIYNIIKSNIRTLDDYKAETEDQQLIHEQHLINAKNFYHRLK
ncbi:Hypothetical_protein [Hexamita inflata]|uniref:Hypothetical_protein n=1 Tax=Hexamita inflata TaxID=28002 RepID=A0AA86NQT6_9EUKA|nr:Hypothetical protein HINF_LOCUS11788 [Hexamita inflata]